MKPKLTQRNRVLKRLSERGFITRNECLNTRPAITRLGAIICSLNKEGYDIKGKDEGNDYVYRADIKIPVTRYTLPDGRTIEVKHHAK